MITNFQLYNLTKYRTKIDFLKLIIIYTYSGVQYMKIF